MTRTTKSSADETIRAMATLKSMTPIEIAQLHIMQTRAAFKYMPEKHEQLTTLFLKQTIALAELHVKDTQTLIDIMPSQKSKLTVQLVKQQRELLKLKQLQLKQAQAHA